MKRVAASGLQSFMRVSLAVDKMRMGLSSALVKVLAGDGVEDGVLGVAG